MNGICRGVALLGLLTLGIHGVLAQDVAESATMNSDSSIATHHAKPSSTEISQFASPERSTSHSSTDIRGAKLSAPTTARPANRRSPSYVAARPGPPLEEVNRKDFEDNAGKEASKLLLRSVPSGAEIFINDRLVGRTPLLMLIAPGKYIIDMRGPRQESGHSTIGLMPKETHTVVIHLDQRYPTSISIR